MRTHDNYYEINASSYFELGCIEGEYFNEFLDYSIEEQRNFSDWKRKIQQSLPYLKYTKESFPHLIEEIEGIAKSTENSIEELFTLMIEDELSETTVNGRCTTLATNNGLMIAHNEDWDTDASEAVCVLKKSVLDKTFLELYYIGTLGGNSISINSHGIIQTINTLSQLDKQIGIPRNILSRWMSETSDPISSLNKFKNIKGASGYHHLLISMNGDVWGLESTGTQHIFSRPSLPFVHTNHYLSSLKKYEDNSDMDFSQTRYSDAVRLIGNEMSIEQMKSLLSNNERGNQKSIFNERTIAKMIIDLQKFEAYIWLDREKIKGWIKYPLDFIKN